MSEIELCGEKSNLNSDESISFDDFQLSENLLHGIYQYGFEKPSILQKNIIVPFIRGKDIVIRATCCTSKTAAFAIGVLQRLDFGMSRCQALIIVPTRELGMATMKIFTSIGHFQQVLCSPYLIGPPITDVVLNESTHVLVTTPTRALSLFQSHSLQPHLIRMVILDDLDEIFGRGLNQSVHDIFQVLPSTVQVGVFAGEMTSEVEDFVKQETKDPFRYDHTKR